MKITISLKTISNKCMQEFAVRTCKSTAANILNSFSYTLKRIHMVPERRNTPETIDSHVLLVDLSRELQAADQFLQYDREIFHFVVLLADQESFYMNRVFLHIILLVIPAFYLHLWSDKEAQK
ncbi:hypothetical protein HZS_108 [Henneguya salminicola]|nr:hypothetical protein HZS_108 [Henneguya salminicola]